MPFAVADCENFYVSCERVFQPRLRGRAVVVLSNNDGCVISRSEEAKLAGVAMGVPLFKARPLIEEHGVEVFSSNYELYGDISGRVMETLEECAGRAERYSIDEAFFDLPDATDERLCAAGEEIRGRVRKWTGLPVTVGIGPTKTLAKLAVSVARKSEKEPRPGVVSLCRPRHAEAALRRVRVEKVWGVGPASARTLKAEGCETALDLSRAEARWVRGRLGAVAARVALELRGVSCLPLEACPPPRRSVTSSRSFGRPVTSLAELREAVAFHVSKAAERLRRARRMARVLLVFLETGRHAAGPRHAPAVSTALPVPTDLTPELVGHAQRLVERAFAEGFEYRKAGVMLLELVPARPAQTGLFDGRDRERDRRVMETIDRLNRQMGRDTVRCARAGFRHAWRMNCARRSPRYTTNWRELLTVAAR